VDLTTSVSNCGGCGAVCAQGDHATPACTNGQCGLTCMADFGDCDGNLSNGCEVPLQTDVAHCGNCTTICPGGLNSTATCTAGRCGIQCNANYDNCDQVIGTGCEQRLSVASNCGRCGMNCPLATPVCVTVGTTSSCGTAASCPTGQMNCNNTCVATATDVDNCGTCGMACPRGPNSTPVCSAGTCRALMCSSGYGDCDSMAANGCETDTRSNSMHCGRCGMACPSRPGSTVRCEASRCVYTCTTSTADCNGDLNATTSDGCETTLGTNAACSSCRGSCAAGLTCCNRVCVDTTSDNSNCGRCGTVCAARTFCGECDPGRCSDPRFCL